MRQSELKWYLCNLENLLPRLNTDRRSDVSALRVIQERMEDCIAILQEKIDRTEQQINSKLEQENE